ncbi:MAG: hypothetical protein IPI04_18640 [Ignavibacteria bacterium]|nr:hypothetical protein [Ignavibacteria bacterium]
MKNSFIKFIVFIISFSLIFSSCAKSLTVIIPSAYPSICIVSDGGKAGLMNTKTHPEIQIHFRRWRRKRNDRCLSGMVDLEWYPALFQKKKQIKVLAYCSSKGCCPSHHKFRKSCIKRSSEQGIKKIDFEKIFITGDITEWGNTTGGSSKEKINVFTRSDAWSRRM